MTYLLQIAYQPDSAASIDCSLRATLQQDNTGILRVIDASIDTDDSKPGTLSLHGMNALRALAMADMIVAHAVGLNPVHPDDEIAQLKKEIARLRSLIPSNEP